MRSGMLVVGWVLLAVLSMVAAGSETPAPTDPNGGLSVWALAGNGVQEGRIEWDGWVEDIGLAVGGVHRDAPDGDVEEWSARGYLLAHALSTEMLASLGGGRWSLPDGNIYAGVFGEYTFDREKEWSGGYVVGALTAWPGKWETVAEFQSDVWNTSDDEDEFVVGLRRRF